MVDYAIDESFDLYFGELNDFETVDGKEEFEQDVLIDIHYGLAQITGENRTENIEEKIRLEVRRTAAKYDAIENIENIRVTKLFNASDTLSVEIVYISGDNFQETI